MLKGISPLLSPDLLRALRAMGHGDDIAVVDANFPAASSARRLVRADGHSATDMLEAILTLLPIDDLREDPLRVMAVTGNADAKPDIVAEFERIASDAEGRSLGAHPLPREEFYATARAAYVVVATGEARLYGNVLVRTGVVVPG